MYNLGDIKIPTLVLYISGHTKPRMVPFQYWNDNCCCRQITLMVGVNPNFPEVDHARLQHVFEHLYRSLTLPIGLRMISHTQIEPRA